MVAEEIEKRLDLSRGDKTKITEIINVTDDSVTEIKITHKSGNVFILRF